MNISDEAVEAAAKAAYENVRPKMGFPSGFDGAPEPMQETYRGIARAGLEAAAPHLMAEAWEQGRVTGSESIRQPNPYRSQA